MFLDEKRFYPREKCFVSVLERYSIRAQLVICVPLFYFQIQGHLEHFRDNCGGTIAWLDGLTSYTGFKEGWAMYAEYPLIGRDTNAYDDEPMQKYGMLKWMVRKHRQEWTHTLLLLYIKLGTSDTIA